MKIYDAVNDVADKMCFLQGSLPPDFHKCLGVYVRTQDLTFISQETPVKPGLELCGIDVAHVPENQPNTAIIHNGSE